MNETWTKYLVENDQPFVVSFDFDGTLTTNEFVFGPYSTIEDTNPNIELIDKMKQYKQKGARVYIVTRRNKDENSIKEIVAFIRAFKLPIDGLHFTNQQDKVHTLSKLGVQLHYDNDPQEISAIKQYAPHIKTIFIK